MGVEVDAFGLFTKPPTLRVDVSAFAVRKLHALRCHRSQVAGDALDHMPDEAAPCVLGAELYRRADVGASRETFLDRMGSSAGT
jgi:LmbE family N-acetylglucosaminyl deacetylase